MHFYFDLWACDKFEFETPVLDQHSYLQDKLIVGIEINDFRWWKYFWKFSKFFQIWKMCFFLDGRFRVFSLIICHLGSILLQIFIIKNIPKKLNSFKRRKTVHLFGTIFDENSLIKLTPGGSRRSIGQTSSCFVWAVEFGAESRDGKIV